VLYVGEGFGSDPILSHHRSLAATAALKEVVPSQLTMSVSGTHSPFAALHKSGRYRGFNCRAFAIARRVSFDPELTSASDARRYVPVRAVIVTTNAMRRLRTGRSTLSRHDRSSTPMVPPRSTQPVVIPSDDTDMDSFSVSSGRRYARPRSASND
jgi:hypothetical protein